MPQRLVRCLLLVSAVLLGGVGVGAAHAARIVQASPQGEVREARQVRLVFDAAVVRLGDPQVADPFKLQCQPALAVGRGRWTSDREWVLDLPQPLPAGTRCELQRQVNWRPSQGTFDGDYRLSFGTGGPAVLQATPWEGAEVEENGWFLLRLSGPALASSITAKAWCEVEGIGERLGVKLIDGAERDAVLKAQRVPAPLQAQTVLLACQRPLPPGAGVRLVWGAGIASAANPQVVTRSDQPLRWQVRSPFTAEFSCEREQADAPCLPLRPLRVRFSSPVPRALALKATLQAAGARALAAQADPSDTADALTEVRFAAPLPPDTRFTLTLPRELKDLSGRPLSNAAGFPLATATGPLPPLAKFAAAPFGILEAGSRDEPAALPVTMRHVQADVAGGQAQGQVRIKRLDASTPDAELMAWIARLARYHENTLSAREAGRPEKDWWTTERITDDNGRSRTVRQERTVATRELSLLSSATGLTQARLPAPPKDAQATEVIGVPLPQPGYHVVEIESQLLGHRLLAQAAPMYVRTGVLVTNLGVHFKRGRTSSLVWVTTLDKARPVAGADVAVNDCRGQRLWAGRTNAQGLAAIPQGFTDEPRDCLSDNGWFVSARRGGDLAFVFSGWQQGIEPWRFNHPTSLEAEPDLRVHTVFDRTLLRAGETVSMKHFVRRETAQGLALLAPGDWPTEVRLTHVGSGDETVLALAAPDGRSAASTWAIPATARLGVYTVSLQRGARTWQGGSLRVEAFKVPLVDARLEAPKGPLIAPRTLSLPVQLTYLSGGGLHAAATFSALLRERWVSMPGYDDYSFQPPRQRRSGPADDAAPDDEPAAHQQLLVDRRALQTDAQGAATATLALPLLDRPMELQAELGFADPNGEIQTAAQTLPLWPAGVVVGLRARSWLAQRGRVQFQAVVLDTRGRPVAGRKVQVSGRAVQRQSTRKRIVGGFYAYDEQQTLRALGPLCKGESDARGLLLCDVDLGEAGEVELIARAEDAEGRAVQAATSVWISAAGETWFAQDNDDRIDVLPEQRELQPGQTARLQVRMPYRQATALVTVEREGVIEARTVTLRGSDPVIELPVPDGKGKGAASWAPNVYVGVLVLRGRVEQVPWYSLLQWGWRAPVDWWHAWRQSGREWRPPGAMVDLAKPSYKFGVAALQVGLQAHRLEVKVTPEREQYAPRQQAQVRVQVTQDGQPVAGARFAFAAVDEALLALKPNDSWSLLEAMFEPRPWGVETSTAQNEIIGRRHHGRKALPAGGGGGRNPTRELFDTLLLWRDSVTLDGRGEAVVEVPLNDALTRFRLVAVADAGADRFGTGSASVRVTQDLQLLAGLPTLLRQGDRFEALYTLRNTTARALTVDVSLQARSEAGVVLPAQAQRVSLPAGGAAEVKWPLQIPADAQRIDWLAEAVATEGARDRLRTSSVVLPAVPLQVWQATLVQPDGPYTLNVAPPAGALAGQGGVQVTLRPRLAGALPGLQRFFETYPYTCLEQQASRAIGLHDAAAWAALGQALGGYLDADGLALYFPSATEGAAQGSDRLTAYLIAAAHSAGWAWPAPLQERMLQGLAAFVEGRVVRRFPAPKADLDVRKLAALEALSRHGRVQPRMLGSLATSAADVQRWPTAALIDWMQLLQRLPTLPERDQRLADAVAQLRGRLVAGGTTLRFADEASDAWWWLMDSADANAARLVLAALDDPAWQQDRPRLLQGLLARLNAQRSGALATTTANVWARLAFDRHAALNEAQPLSGRSRVQLAAQQREVDWSRSPEGDRLTLPWASAPLTVAPPASGRPWLALQSVAAVPLAAPVAAGYRVERSVTPVQQQTPGRWRRGDVLRVQLKIDAAADLGWVVVSDPVPAGATLLGRSLGRDAQIARARETNSGASGLSWEEFRPEAWRGYYAWLPRGSHTVEYTLRLNTAGRFVLPPTRAEAMYAPDSFGETPNAAIEVAP